MKKLIKAVLLFLFVTILGVTSVKAAEFRVPVNEEDLVISENETVRNLYSAGGTIVINANVEKNLYSAGGAITVYGDVEDNAAAFGGSVIIKGQVGGSAYVGAGTATIQGPVTDDLFVGGGNVTISDTASVGGDLIVGGGSVTVEGPVKGNLIVGAGQVLINSQIEGSIKADAESIKLGPNASVQGNITYKSSQEMTVSDSASVSGEVIFNQVDESTYSSMAGKGKMSGFTSGLAYAGFFVKLVVSAATALVLVYFFGKKLQVVVDEAVSHFWSSAGKGFAFLILVPVFALLLLISILGSGLTGIAVTAYILTISISKVVSSIIVGSWLVKVVNKKDKYIVNWKAALFGSLAMSLLSLTAFVGWTVKFIILITAIGALFTLFRKNYLAKS